MLKRIFISIIFLISISWVGYVAYDILTDKSNYSENTLFGKEDGKLLIVNRPNEINYQNILDFNSPSIPLLSNLNNDNIETVFASEKQDHVLIKGIQNWTVELINTLINDSIQKPTFSGNKINYNNYEATYFKKGLYFKRGIINNAVGSLESIKHDKNSSASLITIDSNSFITSVSDLYFLPEGKINYLTENENIAMGKQISDESIFSNVTTSKFESYHFYERDYYATIDSTYLNGPMLGWTNNGFIELVYKGKRALITDYIDGQDPQLILNDINQTQDSNHFKIPLTNNFPESGKSYFVKYLEDHIVISESNEICDKIIADQKLGNTIALNESVRERTYGKLPMLVSERVVSTEATYSKAFFKGKILQTQIGSNEIIKHDLQKETITMNCGFDIADFTTGKGFGNVTAIGFNGEVIGFKDEKKLWSSNVGEKFTGDIQLIDLYDNGEKYVLLNTRNKIHLWNSKGEYSSGFPITSSKEITNEVKFYRWKGKSYFIYANIEGQVVQLDGKGRELDIFNSGISITRKIDVWVSQSKLFAGFANDNQFEMYNLDQQKKHREFTLPNSSLSAKIPNELIQFGINNNRLFKVTQNGTKFDLSQFNHGKILKIVENNKNPIIVIQSANEVHLLNSVGVPFCQIRLSFNEIDDVYIESNANGVATIAIVDGLENNVYLYNLNGEKIQHSTMEGQKKVVSNKSNNGILITTIMDQFIAQYFE